MSWTQKDKELWFSRQKTQRSYNNDVISKIRPLEKTFHVQSYGSIDVEKDNYELYMITSRLFGTSKKTVLITGGVHGYETSGVHGALEFMAKSASKYEDFFNFVTVPCLSPWAYETINRWNPKAIDPNRSFFINSPAEECQMFLNAMDKHRITPLAHFDLHETTDTDNTVFRPDLEKRDGTKHEYSEIPDGFYLVADAQNPQMEFQKAIIERVSTVTHIAQPDSDDCLIGEPIQSEGVIFYELKKLNLCAGFSNASYTTTTEVYPDSPRVTPKICIEAQVAAIEAGLDFIKQTL